MSYLVIGLVVCVSAALGSRIVVVILRYRTKRAALAGNSDAMNSLAIRLRRRGDVAEAETWYRKAANAGHNSARLNLALLSQHHADKN